MKTEHPILFSTPMVQAILQGRKTQTRRVVKFNKSIENPNIGFTTFTPEGFYSVRGTHANGEFGESFFKMPYRKDDILWVRETWQWEGDTKYTDLSPIGSFWYKADFGKGEGPAKWKPSIFMPREACRIRLEITNIRVERLYDISENDAIDEGIEQVTDGYPYFDLYKDYSNKVERTDAISSYTSLWESINGVGSFNKNPWVWMIEFKRI